MRLEKVLLLYSCCFVFCTHDVPITWLSSPRALLPCMVPDADRIPTRRPPPPLATDDRPKPKQPYIWRKGDQELEQSIQSLNYNFSVYSNGTLELKVNKKEKNSSIEGVYQCSVRHFAGVVLGYPVHLKLAYLDRSFSVHPGNSTVFVGQPHVLRCDVKSAPSVAVSWMKDGQPLPNNDRYHVLKNNLLILDVQKEDAGLYRCKATNPHAKDRTRVSHGGRLHVDDSGAVDAEPYLVPVLQQNNITVDRGETVELPCPVTGYPKPKLIWKVTHPGERTAELDHTGEVLTLNHLDSSDDGVYTCNVEGRSDLAKIFNVSTYVPVNITLPPTSNPTALQASTVRFNCTAIGHPTPSITWYKDGKRLTLTGRIVVTSAFGDKRMELLIRSVTSEDAGIYQCFAHNGQSTASAWAVLGVASPGATAPSGVKCWPVGAKHVLVRWPKINDSLAYTVQVSSPGGASYPNQPQLKTEEIITLEEALTPYKFQVRGYVSSHSGKSVASDISESVTCQGQGVPIKFSRLSDGIRVSWRGFAWQTPGVKQWILQYKAEDAAEDSEPFNVTLGPEVSNYTISTPHSSELQIRLLGTMQIPWLQQNLTLVPWRSTVNAGYVPESGDVSAKIDKVEITDISPRKFTVHWRCDEAEQSAETYEYMVCTTKLDEEDEKEECFETSQNYAVVEHLTPGTEYSVRVRATIPSQPYVVTAFSQPIQVGTPIEGAERIKDLTYKVINSSTIRVSWNSVPDKYTVYYNVALSLPINQWPNVDTFGNTVLITGVNTSKPLYVMVSGYEPLGHSAILNIPAREPEVRDLQWTFTSTGLTLSWQGEGPRVVRYSQDSSLPKDQWPGINSTTNTVHITGVDKSKDLYVRVSAHEPLDHIAELHIPVQVPKVKDLQWTFTSTGLTVTWQGEGPRVVHYSQNITQPMDQWPSINVTTNTVHITGLDSSLITHLVVTAPGQLQAFSVPARPPDNSSNTNSAWFYYSAGIGCGILILCIMAAIFCIWHRRKRANSSARSRRRNVSPTEGHEGDLPEMKMVSSHLANGCGSKDAGEPLLNGHVHITENPNQSKTPNGRMRRGHRYEPSFDVARYEDPEITLETVLDDTSSTTFNLLDTSRRPEFDLSRSSRDISANNSFNKLPDDNMNSELTRSIDFQLDNSKILPTLQPNG